MRKFNARWWVDAEFLGRRRDHNYDTAELLLENHDLRPGGGSWSYAAPHWDSSLRGPKTSIVFDYTARKNELKRQMDQAAEAAIDAAKAFTAAQAAYGRHVTSNWGFEFWWPGRKRLGEDESE